jgi:Fringe-like
MVFFLIPCCHSSALRDFGRRMVTYKPRHFFLLLWLCYNTDDSAPGELRQHPFMLLHKPKHKSMKRPPSRSPLPWLRFLALSALLLFAYIFTSRSSARQFRSYFLPILRPVSNPCMGISSGEKIVVIVKTGASEAAEKVPAQMQTSLQCAENVLHFSDLEQDIGQYHTYDALDNISASVVDDNPDFIFYREQKRLWKNERDVSSVRGKKNPSSPNELAAWTLDKYKFLHVLEKTWAMKPGMDWYVLIDADSYIFWENLLAWLDNNMDPGKKWYFGSEVNIDGVRFAHGGSGVVMSRAAVYELVVMNERTAARWDPMIQDKCCGDLVLGMAFKELGIELRDVWPLMSGESPASMPFGPATPEYLCNPALTMHHLNQNDMRELAKFEQRRQSSVGALSLQGKLPKTDRST